MNFDFDNITKYLQPEISAEAQSKIDLLDSYLHCGLLTDRECKFINDVKCRIRGNSAITEKQSAWLAKILQKCKQKRTNN